MNNDIFNQMQKGMSGNLNAVFDKFMQQFRGQNPQSIINELVKSGKISQSQLDMAQERAKHISSAFDGMRHKYNF